MFTVTVRRTPDTYTVKPVGCDKLATLPRPLTEDSGLDAELIEKITTCRKHETRELTAKEMQSLDAFAPVAKASSALPDNAELTLAKMTSTQRAALDAQGVACECTMCLLAIAPGALFKSRPGKGIVCAECYIWMTDCDIERQQKGLAALVAARHIARVQMMEVNA